MIAQCESCCLDIPVLMEEDLRTVLHRSNKAVRVRDAHRNTAHANTYFIDLIMI